MAKLFQNSEAVLVGDSARATATPTIMAHSPSDLTPDSSPAALFASSPQFKAMPVLHLEDGVHWPTLEPKFRHHLPRTSAGLPAPQPVREFCGTALGCYNLWSASRNSLSQLHLGQNKV
jgi:hypothetical protein